MNEKRQVYYSDLGNNKFIFQAVFIQKSKAVTLRYASAKGEEL
jgi:hypothetical protein